MIFQNPLMRAVAEGIRKRREDLQLSQQDLAYQADLPLQTLVNIEELRHPVDTETMRRLEIALNLPKSALYSYAQESNKKE